MSFQYDLMGVIICWALTGLVVLIILFFIIAILYYMFSNNMKKEVNDGVKEMVKCGKEVIKGVLND